MKIKKKDLRKGLAQLPINYPAPTVEDVFDFEKAKHRVEDMCKKLAHVEVEVRDAALNEMPRYLQEVCAVFVDSKGSVADADIELLLQKLSMGLFYCFWHSDKPLVQHECAFKIAQLMNTVPNPVFQRLIVESLFRILSREWGRIDRYRLDKYMSLVRKTLYQLLILTKRHYGEALKKELAKLKEEEKEAKKKGDDDNAEASSSSAEQIREAAEQAALNIPFITHLTNFFQKVILVEPRSVGLTMHLMDVCLDEFIRSDIDVALFVRFSQMIPLFAMSKGDYIEKRVLDNFIGPICSGVLDSRRVALATIATSPEFIKQAALKRKSTTKAAAAAADDANNNNEDEEKKRDHSDENDHIVLRLSVACKELSVSKETRHTVRPMLSEAQMLLEQHLAVKLNPKQFRRLTYRDMRRRVTKELAEAEENVDRTMKFRKIVKDERREIKKKARKAISREQDGGKKKKGGGKKKKLVLDNVDGAEIKGVNASTVSTLRMKQAGEGGKKASKKDKRITIDAGDAVGHEAAAPKKKKAPLDPKIAAKLARKATNINPKVREEIAKIARKEAKNQAKTARLRGGESDSKLSTFGISQNSKRHKYGKLTAKDLVEMESMETPVWKKKK